MITYEPPQLADAVAKACATFARLMDGWTLAEIADGLIDPTSEDFDPDAHDLTITPLTEVTVSLPRSDLYQTSTYRELLDLVEELAGAELEDGVRYWSKQRLLLRVHPGYDDHSFSYRGTLEEAEYPTGALGLDSTSRSGSACRCAIVAGITPFGFLVTRSGDYEKYYPPAMGEDLFVQVTWFGSIERREILEVTEAYLFELESSMGITLSPSPRATVHEVDEDETERRVLIPRLRPLICGKGMEDLHRSYNAAVRSWDPQYRILTLVKVLEYVSQTIVRAQLVDAVRMKLSSSRALEPDAQFALELESVVTEARSYRKDREALRITVSTCCDAFDLAREAPPILKLLRRLDPQADDKSRKAALEEFAGVLYATRNSAAHAKTNYSPTGEECPPEQLGQLAAVARIAAQQAIRWFAARPESSRVL